MKLKDKVQHALDEARMLVLGAQVMLGFDYRGFMMKRFDALGGAVHAVKLATLALMFVTLVLLLTPAAHHRIVERGEDAEELTRFTRRVMNVALVTFTLGLAGDVGVVVHATAGLAAAIVAAVVTTVACSVAWLGYPWSRRRTGPSEDEMEKADLNDKIRHVLTEARVVLPGTQALLGFQLVAVLEEGFTALPTASKAMHVVALASLVVSVVLLMMPAAYHRIAERGEISERLHVLSGRALVAAMIALAVALSADAFIVVLRVTDSLPLAIGFAAAFCAIALSTWIGWMMIIRRKGGPRRSTPRNPPILAGGTA